MLPGDGWARGTIREVQRRGMESEEVRYRRCESALEQRGQQQVLRWWGDLNAEERHRLLSDIESIPWNRVAPLIESHVRNTPVASPPGNLAPAPYLPLVPEGTQLARYAEATTRGEEMLRAGRVATIFRRQWPGRAQVFDACPRSRPKGS